MNHSKKYARNITNNIISINNKVSEPFENVNLVYIIMSEWIIQETFEYIQIYVYIL